MKFLKKVHYEKLTIVTHRAIENKQYILLNLYRWR